MDCNEIPLKTDKEMLKTRDDSTGECQKRAPG